jgi:hypothetical protein
MTIYGEIRLFTTASIFMVPFYGVFTTNNLDFVLFADPGPRVVQKIVRDIFIYTVPAQVNEQHALDLAKDQQFRCIFAANETPVRSVFLLKLVKFVVIVLHTSSLVTFVTKIDFIS